MRALELGKKFVRVYFGYQRITRDMLNPRRDGLIEILSSYGHRIYVDEEKNIVYWGEMGTAPNHPNLVGLIHARRATNMGFELKMIKFQSVNYIEIVGWEMNG